MHGRELRAAIMLLTTAVFFAVQAGVHVLTRLVPAYLAYFRPGFHPNDRDTGPLLAEWRGRLFDDRGELRAG